MTKKTIITFLKLAISVILFILVLYKVNIKHLLAVLMSLKAYYFLSAFTLMIVEQILFACIWHRILSAKSIIVSFPRIIHIMFTSSFVGAILPTGIGTELSKLHQLYKNSCKPLDCIGSLLIVKAISISSLLVASFFGVLAAFYFGLIITKRLYISILIINVVFFALAYFLLNNRFLPSIARNITETSNVINKKIKQLYNSIAIFQGKKRTIYTTLTMGMLIQIVRIITIYIASIALDLHISIHYFIIFVPLITFVALLPISLAGIGVREGAFVYFLKFAGVSSTDAFALSLVVFILTMCINLSGGLLYIFESLNTRKLPQFAN